MAKQRKLNTPEKRARVGERIKVAATQAGLSLKDLAEQAAVSPSAVYQYVRGITAVPEALLERIAAVTRVHLSFFDPDHDARQVFALPLDASDAGGVGTEEARDAEPGAVYEAEYLKARAVVEAYWAPGSSRASYQAALQRLLVLSRVRDGGELPVTLLANIGRAQMEDGLLETALSSLSDARQLAGRDYPEKWAQITLDAAACCAARGEAAEARRYLEQLAGAESSPLRWEALAQLGRLRARAGDYFGAIAHFERAAQAVTAENSRRHERRAQGALSAALAELAYNTGHFEAAHALWDAAARLAMQRKDAPGYLEAVTELGRCEEASGHLARAVRRQETAAALAAFSPNLNDRRVSALVLLSRVQTVAGAQSAAIESARQAYRLSQGSDVPADAVSGSIAMAQQLVAGFQFAEALDFADEALKAAVRTNRNSDGAAAQLIRAQALLGSAGGGQPGAGHDAQPLLVQAMEAAQTALDAAGSPRHCALLLEAQLAIADIHRAMGRDRDAETSAAALLDTIDAGPGEVSTLLAGGADCLVALLAEEVNVPAQFRMAARIALPLLEWQVHALRATLAAARNDSEAAHSSFARASQIVAAITDGLSRPEAAAFRRANPRLALLESGSAQPGAASTPATDVHSLLDRMIAAPNEGVTAVVGAVVAPVA